MRRAGTKGNERVSGFVLAGGASRRFGSNKALATHRGRSLLALALRAMRELNIHPRIVAPDPAPFRRYRAPVLTGERPGLGPVEGVRVALTHAASESSDWALILAVDMPGVTSAVLRPLLASIRAGGTGPAAGRTEPVVCYGEPGGRLHPFPGLYHRSVLRAFSSAPEGTSMHRVIESVGATLLSAAFVGRIRVASALRNVNRREDLTETV